MAPKYTKNNQKRQNSFHNRLGVQRNRGFKEDKQLISSSSTTIMATARSIKSRNSVKNRLTLNTNKGALKSDNLNHRQGKTIVKTVQQSVKGKNTIKLFTNHFNVRSKLVSSTNTSKKLKNKELNLSNEIAKRALDEVKDEQKRQLNQPKKSKSESFVKPRSYQNSERESTFTGKSIQVRTKNTLAMKERESHLKGTTLSVVANNIGKKSLHKKHHKVQHNINTRDVLPIAEPPVAISPKKPIPAKMIITNLHQNVTQDDIKELFGAVGKLKEARLKNIGTAEVIYVNSEDAFEAYNKYNTRNLDGQPMILKITTVDESFSNAAFSARNDIQYGGPSAMSVPEQYGRSNYRNNDINNHNQMPTNGNTGKPVVFTVRL